MGAGAPIVNIQNIEECITKVLLKNYPLKLNLQPSLYEIDCVISDFISFCKKVKNQKVQYDVVEKEYSNYLADNVSNKFLNILQNN